MSQAKNPFKFAGERPSLPPLPETPAVAAARAVVSTLQGAGHEAYFVGGFVRDWILGIEHYDVDVATSAHPDKVEELFPETRAVGKSFGVVLVRVENIDVEVATFRSDHEYEDFRRPTSVTYGTVEDDAARRDFTVNALYYDPTHAVLRDFHAGALDLRRRILRTVGPPIKRFQEDALRLLRAVRFAAAYSLEIEPRTAKAIERHSKNLAEISRERVGMELLRILTGPHADRAMRLMEELGLWPFAIPEIQSLRGVRQGEEAHPEGDVFEHTACVLANLPDRPDPALALAALLHDIGKPSTAAEAEGRIQFHGHQRVGAEMALEICKRLRYSAELTERVAVLIHRHMDFMQARDMKESTLKRFVTQPDFELHLELHRADTLGSHGDLGAYEFCLEQRRKLSVEHGEPMKPKPLADGNDLIALGFRPGPEFARMLDAMYDGQLERRIRTREEALEYLKSQAHPPESS